MRLVDLFRLALGNLRENPLRTGLCALSVAVGTGALLLIASIGLFGKTQVDVTLQTLGVSGLTVYLDNHGSGNPLSAELADQMGQAVEEIEQVMPIKAKTGTIRAGYVSENAVFLGADERLGDVMRLEVLFGSLLTERQAASGQPVAVVGDDLAQALYGRANIVGRTVRVRLDGVEQYFTVCGVVRAQTSALGGALSSFAPHLIYIPYAYLASRQENADQVFVQCAAEADLSHVSSRISGYLTDRGKVDGTVRVQNMSGMVDAVEQMANLCILLFLVVGGITLCVALIGVLCSMLAATHEKQGRSVCFWRWGRSRVISGVCFCCNPLCCALLAASAAGDRFACCCCSVVLFYCRAGCCLRRSCSFPSSAERWQACCQPFGRHGSTRSTQS